jgi:hypothetical protein
MKLNLENNQNLAIFTCDNANKKQVLNSHFFLFALSHVNIAKFWLFSKFSFMDLILNCVDHINASLFVLVGSCFTGQCSENSEIQLLDDIV